MPKKNNEEKAQEGLGDFTPPPADVPDISDGTVNAIAPEKSNSGSGIGSGEDKKDPLHPEIKDELLAIEEHKKNLKIDASVFAAVMTSQGWATGKKVPEAVFIKAIESFLGSPMGGK